MATCLPHILTGSTAVCSRLAIVIKRKNAAPDPEKSLSARAAAIACRCAFCHQCHSCNVEQEAAIDSAIGRRSSAFNDVGTAALVIGRSASSSSPFCSSIRRRRRSPPYVGKTRCVATTAGAQQQASEPSGADSAAAADAAAEAASLSEAQQQTGVIMTYTHWEQNSFLLEIGGVRIAVDPIIGDLDFGLPSLVAVKKVALAGMTVKDIPEVDCILITQGFDDHCHLPTLRMLAKDRPNVPVIAAVNAKRMMDGLFRNTTYLEHGTTTEVRGQEGAAAAVVSITATVGDLIGPPWQLRENGYVLSVARPPNAKFTLYMEPHCRWGGDLPEEKIDCVITPVVKAVVKPVGYAIVEGMDSAVNLLRKLKPRYVIPLRNGSSKLEGLLSPAFGSEGSIPEFIEILRRDGGDAANAEVLVSNPGVPLQIPF
ncbi:hypothetical protein CBR_g46806 [Chara braunii]|uniref:Metallo-beta-lactamase domain-containing protein n=1 Tax=Chara braunii TaxID=69332 RepID=A0A388M181_CHABU|nr:hypothetical protein CBR_g46806 [Chara braunii]|eukprot:GBG88239.1 hypothetical protein CBR_g46806 [Chara braunii]